MMASYELPRLYWWRVEVSLEFATVFTMVQAATADQARAIAIREQRTQGRYPLGCSKPVPVGEV